MGIRMKFKLKQNLIKSSLILFLCVCLAGCGLVEKTPKQVQKSFETFSNQLFQEEITSNTINLHYTLAHPENFGIKEYKTTLGDFSLASLASAKEDLTKLLNILESFEYDKLTSEQQLTYDIMHDDLETEISAAHLYLYTELLSPTVGYQAQLPVLLSEYAFRTRQDIQDYLVLTGQIDDIFQQIILFEQEKSRQGLFMSDTTLDHILSQCQEFIKEPEHNYMIATFNDKIDAFPQLSDQEKQAYKNKNYELVTSDVVKGYQLLMDGLTALRGTGTNEGGLCYYKDGTEYYEYLVRTQTGSAKSIEQLQKNTSSFINTSLQEMLEIIMANPSVEQTFRDHTFAFTEPKDIIIDLASKVSMDFPTPPTVNCTIKYVHKSMEEHLSPAFYLTPPIDDVMNNVIYINNASVSSDLYTTLAHEGYPGHLYQTVYTSSKNLPLVRNLYHYSGYTEGWATYVEYYSYGISGLEENLAKALSLNGAASLGLYAYIDMGIHYNGWGKKEVQAYLSSYGIQSPETASLIFETMVEEPANYLSYFIGYLEFLELRDTAKAALGDNFTLKEFHDFLLSTGPAPFDILEKYMLPWMEAENGESFLNVQD